MAPRPSLICHVRLMCSTESKELWGIELLLTQSSGEPSIQPFFYLFSAHKHTACMHRPHFIGEVKLQGQSLWMSVATIQWMQHLGSFWLETPEPARTKNLTFIFWLLIGLSYLRTKLPSLRRTQYVQLCLKIRKPSDSSLSCIRPTFSTLYLCLSCPVIYQHTATVLFVRVLDQHKC